MACSGGFESYGFNSGGGKRERLAGACKANRFNGDSSWMPPQALSETEGRSMVRRFDKTYLAVYLTCGIGLVSFKIGLGKRNWDANVTTVSHIR
jgi:hypothetical protein